MLPLHRRRTAILIALSVVVLFYQLGTPRLWDRDEPRNAGAAREMLARGDWIVPTFNAELRDHKPVLLYWGQMTASLLIGESEWSARLPSAVAALLAMLGTALVASRIAGRSRGISQEGFWAAAVLGTSTLFVMVGRAATPDGCLVAFSTLGIALLVIASIKPYPPFRSGRVGRVHGGLAVAGYAMLGLATLAKGPVGFILPLAVVHLWWMISAWIQAHESRQEPAAEEQPSASNHAVGVVTCRDVGRAAGRWGSETFLGHARERLHSLLDETWQMLGPGAIFRAVVSLRTTVGLLVILLTALPWYIAVGIETDGAFLKGFFWEHNVGRALQPLEGHTGGWWFYPASMTVGLFPWSLWLIPLGVWACGAWRQHPAARQLVLLGTCWVVVYVGAFSLASTKLPSYVVPCYPGIALLFGCFMRQFEAGRSVPSILWRRIQYGLSIAIGVVIVAAVIIAANHLEMPAVSVAAISGMAVAVAGMTSIYLDKRRAVRAVPTCCLIAATVFQVGIFGMGATRASHYRNDLVALESLQQSQPLTDWASVGGLEPSWVYYLRTPIREFTPGPGRETKEVTEELRHWLDSKPTARLIVVGETGQAVLEALRQQYDVNQKLERILDTKRFATDDTLSVYGWHRHEAASAQQAQAYFYQAR